VGGLDLCVSRGRERRKARSDGKRKRKPDLRPASELQFRVDREVTMNETTRQSQEPRPDPNAERAILKSSPEKTAAEAERWIDDAAGRVWSVVRRHPILGGMMGAGALLAAAAAYGASEAAVAALGGYMAYRALRARNARKAHDTQGNGASSPEPNAA
jgi:hypothetical protein